MTRVRSLGSNDILRATMLLSVKSWIKSSLLRVRSVRVIEVFRPTFLSSLRILSDEVDNRRQIDSPHSLAKRYLFRVITMTDDLGSFVSS